MDEDHATEPGGIRARSEEALSELAQALLENPLFSQAVGRALGAGEKAFQAQRQALGVLDVASAGDVDRVAKRLRALSSRVEALEDTVDELRAELRKVRTDATSTSS